jgi:hypothetical protein
MPEQCSMMNKSVMVCLVSGALLQQMTAIMTNVSMRATTLSR